MTPSAIPEATASRRGVVSAGAQEFGGAKTLSGAILNGVTTIAEAVTALVRAVGVALVLRSSLGSSSSDRCVVVGSSDTDGNNHASAKQLSIGTGIGGTYVERSFFQKSGLTFWGSGQSIIKWDNGGANHWEMRATPDQVSPGGDWTVGNNSAIYMGCRINDGYIFSAFGLEIIAAGVSYAKLWGSSNSGRLDQYGSDSTATPGSRTGANAINRPTGISSIANGQTTCQIDNSHVTTGSRVLITFHANPGAHWWVTRAAGSFTVNVASAVGADTPFSWEVSRLL